MNTAEALAHVFTSHNVRPHGPEDFANVVDVIDSLVTQASRVAQAIVADAGPGTDASGGTITSLTEAVMGVTAGLHAIADAINNLEIGS